MKAVILAGGLGARLRPLSSIIPKALLPVGESSVLEIQVLSLKEHDVTDIFIATYYRADYIQAFLGDGSKYGVSMHYSTESKPLGTCGPLTLLKQHLHEPFILMNGDILTTLNFTDLSRYAAERDARLTVVTKEIATPFDFGKVVSQDGYILDMEEKPDFKVEIIAGIYVIEPRLFDIIPEDTYYGIDDLIKDMLARQMKVAQYKTKDYWLDIGQMDDYEVAEEVYAKHFNHLKAGDASGGPIQT